jgi:tetratricopeptide (TPR) repeat protein
MTRLTVIAVTLTVALEACAPSVAEPARVLRGTGAEPSPAGEGDCRGPPDHRAVFQQAETLAEHGRWREAETTLIEATRQAAGFANYWYWRGLSVVRQGDQLADVRLRRQAYERARPSLARCVELDPGYAECFHQLAFAEEWTGHAQAALDHYAKAIELDPGVAYFYPPFIEQLLVWKYYEEADRILREAFRLIPANDRTRNSRYGLYVLWFGLHQARHDEASMVRDAESAYELVPGRPEAVYTLGTVYATVHPHRREKALQYLGQFLDLWCRGAPVPRFVVSCKVAGEMVARLRSGAREPSPE